MQSRSVLWLIISLLLWAQLDLSLAQLQSQTLTVELLEDSFTLSRNAAIAGGILTLDSRTSEATAIYKNPLSLGASSSFSTVFTFSTNASYANGTLAFVIVPSGSLAGGLKTAEQTLSLEFNSAYYNRSSDYNGDDDSPGSAGPSWRRGGPYHGYGGPEYWGGLNVSDYVDGKLLPPLPIWTSPTGCLPDGGPYFCPVGQYGMADDFPSSGFKYEVALEYNLTTHTLAVGTLGCTWSLNPSISQFATFLNYSVDLSSVVDGNMFLGFVASNGAIFNVSQCNFTINPTSSVMTSLALQTSSSADGTTTSPGASADNGGSSSSKLSKGYVIAFSLIGAGIGVTTVFLVCFLCRRKPRAVSTSRVRGDIPEGAIIFDTPIKAAPPPKRHHDTSPLQPRPAVNSSDFALTGTASWLKPVNAR